MKSLILSRNLINGQEGELENWNQINWRKVNKLIRNLQQRIFRARKLGKWKQLRRLQKLFIRNYANLLSSVKQITQINTGKSTKGVDKEVIETPAQRVKLVNEWKMPGANPTRRVFIPKVNGKKRPLGIPTIRDRIAQNIVKNALEPEWEAVFEPNSYGFRKGRSCHDAIGQAFLRLQQGKRTGDSWVLDADIKGYFDNLAHKTILNNLDTFPHKNLIANWLRAGYIYNGVYQQTDCGTPQGGVISPLLANIGLHGLETIVKSHKRLGIVRYADDFIITAKTEAELKEVIPKVEQWLKERGLELNKEKTKIVHMTDGFDFLGFNLRHLKGKLLIKPQKEKVLLFCKKVGQIIKNYSSVKQEILIRKLNPILQGFANYYQGVVSKKTFEYISYRVWNYLWSWCKRRHHKRRLRWVMNKYFHRVKGVKWTFCCKVKDRRNKEKDLILYRIESTPITRHVKVKGEASPFDKEFSQYWENRYKQMGKKKWTNGSKNEQLAKNQNWKCPICGEPLANGEDIETHHIVPVKDGGTDRIDNLIHLHKSCHKQVHSKSKQLGLEVWLEPCNE